MLKKVIKYTDFNGVEREEEFYFNLTKGELIEMEFSKHGGFETYIKKIATTTDTPELMKFFKELILASYGEKSDDGRRFIKNQELRDSFEQSAAYSELLTEMLLSANASSAIEFVNGLLPADLNFGEIDPKDIPKIPGIDNEELMKKIAARQPVEKPGPPK